MIEKLQLAERQGRSMCLLSINQFANPGGILHLEDVEGKRR